VSADEQLRAKVRANLTRLGDVEEKQIVGGIGFTWRGNLLCGVMAGDLLVRVARRDFDEFVGEEGARPMVMGGKPSKGWIMVGNATVRRVPSLRKWLDRAIDYVATLPAK
jgi:TfoX/Sxy family transcriptional regulator of competence genes